MVGSPRTVVLFANQSLAAAATTTGLAVVVPMGYKSVRIKLSTDAGAGTSPTLDVYVQHGFKSPATTDLLGNDTTGTVVFDDYVHFAQVTTTPLVQYANIYPTASYTSLAKDVALAAATIQNGPIGQVWRVKVVVGGTSPLFANVNVAAEFLPW